VTWLNPIAFAGLALLAVPIIVHLFARRSTRVLQFPTLRFINDARAVAPRRARLTDVLLLVLRLAIIALAVAALAQPHWMTGARLAELQGQVARAVIVDTSGSVARVTAAGEGGVLLARREGTRLADEASTSIVVETDQPFAELRGAAAWLSETGIGYREAVIVSDFQRGVITQADVDALSADVGVGLVRVDVAGAVTPGEARVIPTVSVVASDADQRAAEATVESGVGQRATETGRPATGEGERERRIVVDFTGPVLDGAAPDELWMGDVIWALRDDSVRVGRRDGALVIAPIAKPGTLASALIVRRVVDAATGAPGNERDSVTIPDSVLRAWERPGSGNAAVAAGAGSDGRWLWVIVLLLLVAEQIARRGRPSAEGREARG
jgi:hypothetical protein